MVSARPKVAGRKGAPGALGLAGPTTPDRDQAAVACLVLYPPALQKGVPGKPGIPQSVRDVVPVEGFEAAAVDRLEFGPFDSLFG